MADGSAGLFVGALVLGIVHGIEPGHGWPVAAAYAVQKPRKWAFGVAASVILGVGHLVSSLTVVAVFLLARAWLDLERWTRPIALAEGIRIGSPIDVAAGIVLVALGVRMLVRARSGSAHGHHHGHRHDHDHHHNRPHDHHGLGHADADEAARKGLWGLAAFAFALGFAHEEEIQIIGMCAGADSLCVPLMATYALAVIGALVAVTLVLIAGYALAEERVEKWARHFPLVSALVLIVMGAGFALGAF